MALIKLHSGKVQPITHEKAAAIWQVMQGEIDGTPEQIKFCDQVKDIYLDWRIAPESYIRVNRKAIAAIATFHGVSLESLPETERQMAGDEWYKKI